ncbi:DUF262 domain-containing protein [Halapricum hydrolyticum]|uniref:DUF262 domain-containing HNH endonuclease family protein n=1 Tax=Halapricum hydrolyticum TaxID=2979991 RepID=A0AAE3LKQ2_9EURY|nr:DUF262 domain-containing HNH endonuclease family protein [Halapricum hydrolyticum]MCU4719679.1 DUF262 domain-containing HNH endonuclease family protein [Halapricum hydrolyticum]MCU4728598.1 DUF262 domain-containing HNH endonuclease family protein [Halapricum hydrolyticum]
MEARYKKIRDLFGGKRGAVFHVPEYQRGYEWEKKHWRDLWTDVDRIGKQVEQHYLGNIILLKRDSGSLYEIVDGQQRMVTISILMMSIRDTPHFGTEDGRLGDVRLEDILEVNRGDDPEPKIILADEEAEEEFNKLWRGEVEDANGRVRKAYEYYSGEVDGLEEQELEELLNNICDYLRVVETVATDPSLAYSIFQSQNERGKEVSPQILAKARIHGAAEDIDDLEKSKEITRRWGHIYNLLEDDLGGPRFQRRLRIRRPMTQILINSEVPTPRQVDKSELYRNFEKVLDNYDDVYDFVMWFQDQVDIYLQISSNSYDVEGRNVPDDAIRHLQYLNSASTHSEVLSLAIYNNIEDDILLKENFRLASILAMRMELSSMSSADTRDAIYGTAAEVRKTEDQNDIRQTLRDCIREYTPSDGEIEEYLKANSMNIRGSWNFRTLLALVSIEEERRGPWKMEIEDLHIEHIAPRNTYGDPDYYEWRERLDDDRFEQQKDMLGNLTLLLDSDHASVVETSFSDKKRTYSDSDVKIAEEVSRYEDWTSEDIDQRTEDLAKELIDRWSL